MRLGGAPCCCCFAQQQPAAARLRLPPARAANTSSESAGRLRAVLEQVDDELRKGNDEAALSLVRGSQGEGGGLRCFGAASIHAPTPSPQALMNSWGPPPPAKPALAKPPSAKPKSIVCPPLCQITPFALHILGFSLGFSSEHGSKYHLFPPVPEVVVAWEQCDDCARVWPQENGSVGARGRRRRAVGWGCGQYVAAAKAFIAERRERKNYWERERGDPLILDHMIQDSIDYLGENS